VQLSPDRRGRSGFLSLFFLVYGRRMARKPAPLLGFLKSNPDIFRANPDIFRVILTFSGRYPQVEGLS